MINRYFGLVGRFFFRALAATELGAKRQKMPARSRLPAERCVESALSLMMKDPDHNATDSARPAAAADRRIGSLK